ncbi:hypothetical protein ACI2L4_16020 [Streptomyces sparsogenes]|uniref:oxidoreductase n=1 Tax=Streptomyces sparsogenes TaxID=67365 RepID=UPI0033EC898E
MSRNDPVLQPLRVNNLTLRNRVYSTGHAPSGYLDGGAPGPRYALYHEEKAKGGIALTIIGGSSNVAPDSANVFDQIDAGDDAVLPFYRSISERVHEHGAAIMLQVTHLGRRSKWDIDRWLPAVGPSAVRERAHRSFPKEIERFDIDRIVKAYGAAARRAREGGLDGIEIAAMAGHLIDQFWSPRTNHRDDEFGGTPRPGRRVLVYDDHGGEQALTAAERLAAAGVRVELVTPDRMVGAEVTGTIHPDYLRALYASGAVLTPDHELRSVRRENGALVATLANVYSDAVVERTVDEVVVEHGTLPVDDLYGRLRAGSRNLGETDLVALTEGRPQTAVAHADGDYQLFRIGDAVAHRNIHAAILDARRLCMAL